MDSDQIERILDIYNEDKNEIKFYRELKKLPTDLGENLFLINDLGRMRIMELYSEKFHDGELIFEFQSDNHSKYKAIQFNIELESKRFELNRHWSSNNNTIVFIRPCEFKKFMGIVHSFDKEIKCVFDMYYADKIKSSQYFQYYLSAINDQMTEKFKKY